MSTSTLTEGFLERHCRYLGEIVRRRDLTAAELQRDFLRPRKPVILQGAMDAWPGLGKWSFEHLEREHGAATIHVGRLFRPQGTMTLAEYFEYTRAWRAEQGTERPDELPLYADGCFVRDLPGLERDFTIPPAFAELDWFERLPRGNPMGRGYLLIGPQGSMTKLHIDGHYTHAWVAQFQGRKRWNVVPFEHLAPFFRNGYFDYIAEWDGVYPAGFAEWPGLKDLGYYSAVLEPGEIIVAPSGQFHEVFNLEDSVALSSNFVERSNARQALTSVLLARVGLRRAKPRYGTF